MTTDVLLIALANIERDARTLNLARVLAKAGLRTTVIAAADGSLESEKFELIPWEDPGGRVRSRMASLKMFVKSCGVRARVVAGMDLFALGAASHCATETSSPLVYDMREFYFALGPLAGKGLKQKVVAAYERRLLKKVKAVMVSSSLDAGVVQDHFERLPAPTVVMNTPPYQERVDSTILRDAHDIADEATIVLYQGVVHHGRGLAPFMEAMSLMPSVHLCVVGDGPALNDLRELAVTLNVESMVHWHGPVSYDQLHAVTCSADIGLCLIEPVSMSYEYALPNKFFEYMMARIPVVCTDLPALRQEVMARPVGMLVGRGLKPTDIADAVKQLQVPATREAMIQASSDVRSVAYEQQAQHATDLFRELM